MTIKVRTKKGVTEEQANRWEVSRVINLDEKFALMKDAFVTLDVEEKNPDIVEKYKKCAQDTTLEFFFFVSIGWWEAAFYLGDMINRDMGINTDENVKCRLADLALGIGQRFGDEECERIMTEEGCVDVDRDILHCADICVRLMKNNHAEIDAMLARGEPMTRAKIIGYTMQFDSVVKAACGNSFLEIIGESLWHMVMDCVELVDNNPQALVEYYSHDHHDEPIATELVGCTCEIM